MQSLNIKMPSFNFLLLLVAGAVFSSASLPALELNTEARLVMRPKISEKMFDDLVFASLHPEALNGKEATAIGRLYDFSKIEKDHPELVEMARKGNAEAFEGVRKIAQEEVLSTGRGLVERANGESFNTQKLTDALSTAAQQLEGLNRTRFAGIETRIKQGITGYVEGLKEVGGVDKGLAFAEVQSFAAGSSSPAARALGEKLGSWVTTKDILAPGDIETVGEIGKIANNLKSAMSAEDRAKFEESIAGQLDSIMSRGDKLSERSSDLAALKSMIAEIDPHNSAALEKLGHLVAGRAKMSVTGTAEYAKIIEQAAKDAGINVAGKTTVELKAELETKLTKGEFDRTLRKAAYEADKADTIFLAETNAKAFEATLKAEGTPQRGKRIPCAGRLTNFCADPPNGMGGCKALAKTGVAGVSASVFTGLAVAANSFMNGEKPTAGDPAVNANAANKGQPPVHGKSGQTPPTKNKLQTF